MNDTGQQKLNEILSERWDLESAFQEGKVSWDKAKKGSAYLADQYNQLMEQEYKKSEIDYKQNCPCGLLHTYETKALIATDRVR
jgi:hypothetical protein